MIKALSELCELSGIRCVTRSSIPKSRQTKRSAMLFTIHSEFASPDPHPQPHSIPRLEVMAFDAISHIATFRRIFPGCFFVCAEGPYGKTVIDANSPGAVPADIEAA